MHTLYDAFTANNRYLRSEIEEEQVLGIITALPALVIMIAAQFVILIRLKKNTERYCGMTVDLTGAGQ